MNKIRFIFALLIAKLSKPILRLFKYNASNFPGKLAIKLCPDFLARIGKPGKIIVVTGTNGKTTACNMTIDILEQKGYTVLNNRLGSNLHTGIATSLISGCSIFGKAKYELAVFEVDERASIRIFPYVRPDYLLITNLFRDSIMRNAHPEYIRDLLSSSIPETTKLVLNADDLISAETAPDNKRVYFGIDKMESDITECINLINDIRICPKCNGALKYDYLRYHHIGKAHCADCDYKSPEYDYRAYDVNMENMIMSFSDHDETQSYKLLSDSTFNIYNMVAVIALLREFGLTHAEISAGMEMSEIVRTRYNSEKVGNVNVITQMAKEKNALACSRAFDYVRSQPGKKELILMMNCLHDAKYWSENACWLYDCDFEFLNNENITRIVATGQRAKDYYLRLLLAGLPEEKLRCTLHELDAPNLLEYSPGESIYVFHGTDSLSLSFVVRDKVKKIAQEVAANEN